MHIPLRLAEKLVPPTKFTNTCTKTKFVQKREKHINRACKRAHTNMMCLQKHDNIYTLSSEKLICHVSMLQSLSIKMSRKKAKLDVPASEVEDNRQYLQKTIEDANASTVHINAYVDDFISICTSFRIGELPTNRNGVKKTMDDVHNLTIICRMRRDITVTACQSAMKLLDTSNTAGECYATEMDKVNEAIVGLNEVMNHFFKDICEFGTYIANHVLQTPSCRVTLEEARCFWSLTKDMCISRKILMRALEHTHITGDIMAKIKDVYGFDGARVLKGMLPGPSDIARRERNGGRLF